MSKNNDYENQTVFKVEEESKNKQSNPEKAPQSTGLDQNIAGLLCYLCWFITGIIFILIEKENRFVRFHAMQSIAISVVLFAISLILILIPIIGWLFGLLLMPISVVLWVFMMYKAYKGEMYKLPIVGDFSEKQIDA